MKQRRITATLTIAALALTTILILTILPLASTAASRLQAKEGNFSCDDVTEIPQAECEALVALYNSTDGADWSNNSGWMDTSTPCNWYGVTCSPGHVARLELGSNQLAGSIPAQLGNLTNLTKLSLYDNQLSGSIPPELGNLTSLVDLWLHTNPLSGALPRSLMNLNDLQEFSFHDTNLCEPGDAAFQAWLASIANLYSTGVICPSLAYIGPLYLPADAVMVDEADGPITTGDHVHLRLPFKNTGSQSFSNVTVQVLGSQQTGSSPGVRIHNGTNWGNKQSN